MLKPQLGAAGSKLEKLRGLNQRNRTKVELVLNRYEWQFDFGKTRGCFCKITRDDRRLTCLTWDRYDLGRQPQIGRQGSGDEGLAGGGMPKRTAEPDRAAAVRRSAPRVALWCRKNTQLGGKESGW
jgi:hypothetical protein